MSINETKFTKIFVKNISETTSDEDLHKVFSEFGPITSVEVLKNKDGTAKCRAFIDFEDAEDADDAARAVELLNGKKINEKEWFVKRALKISEGSNLYVKYLADSVTDEQFKDMFSPFGSITSCKVMRDAKGISRGFGFVAFSSPEEANRALDSMNEKMIAGKPLYVAIAQKKEDRLESLQARFTQLNPETMGPTIVPRMPPMYQPVLGPYMPMYQPVLWQQQIFYAQPQGIMYYPQMSPSGYVPYEMGGLPLSNAQPNPIGSVFYYYQPNLNNWRP